jgi:hypothetical protein
MSSQVARGGYATQGVTMKAKLEKGLTTGPTPHLLTAADVAQRLRIHPKRVYDLPIPQVRPSAGRVRWLPSDIDAFIARMRAA